MSKHCLFLYNVGVLGNKIKTCKKMKTKIKNTGFGLLVSAMEIKAFVLALLASAAFAASGGMLVKNGDRIVFMGDSITHYGVERSHGYVRLTLQGLDRTRRSGREGLADASAFSARCRRQSSRHRDD